MFKIIKIETYKNKNMKKHIIKDGQNKIICILLTNPLECVLIYLNDYVNV